MRSVRGSRATVGLLAAALLVAASACGADRPDRLVSTSATDPSEVDSAPEPRATLPAAAEADEPAPTVEAAGVVVDAPFAGAAADEVVPVQWLVPWDDGFLAVGVAYPPQPLPGELPPEIAELFPPEVTALFPDGLPPTQQEAIEILEEADLFDVVMDVLNEHPEAMEALQSAPRPDGELVAEWSVDGDTWTPTAATLPEGVGNVAQLAVSGDRLTIAGTTAPADDERSWTTTVASTTDLETWTTTSFEIALPVDLPEDVQVWANPVAVAADDENWVARIMVDSSVDPFQYLDADSQEQLMDEGSWFSVGPDGVTIAEDEIDETMESRLVTWEELGVPDTVVPYLTSSQSRSELWSGRWDGAPTPSASEESFGPLIATSAGFLDLGNRLAFSPDGRSWTEVPTPGPNLNIQAAVPLGDDVIAIAGTPFGQTSIHLLDATGTTWSDVTVPGLDDPFSVWNWAASPAFVVERDTPVPEPQTVIVEHDGFELTQVFGEVVSYELVDLSTGEVVAAESVDLATTPVPTGGPFEHFTEDATGVTIADPVTGATIVQIPQAVMGRAWQEATGQDDPDVEHREPDLWLLATADGATWLFEDLDDVVYQDPYPPQFVVTNGETVLVGTIGWEPDTAVWHRFTLAE